MKILLLFMFVAVALATEESKVGVDELARKIARGFRIDPMDSVECVRKSGVTMEDLRYMEDAIVLSETETMDMKSLKRAGCLMVCCAEKKGIMQGGKVLDDEVFEFIGIYGLENDKEIGLRNIVQTCKEEVADASDECMAAYTFLKCVYKKTTSMVQHK